MTFSTRLDEFLANGYEMRNMDTGEPLAAIRERVLSANAYMGAFPLAEALATGADVVIAGRSADAALTLAPMSTASAGSPTISTSWPPAWSPATSSNAARNAPAAIARWIGGTIPDLANIGYPIVEAEPDGSFAVTKHPGTGGRVSIARVKEQLLYEIGDPRRYMTPDCVADFTTHSSGGAGPDRVRVSGVRGGPRPPTLKLSISYTQRLEGHRHAGLQLAAGARKGARRRPHRARSAWPAGPASSTKSIPNSSASTRATAPAAPPNPDPPEVQLRIGVRGPDRAAVDRFTRELIPLVLNGPPGATGFGEGRPPTRDRGLLVGAGAARRDRDARDGGGTAVRFSTPNARRVL